MLHRGYVGNTYMHIENAYATPPHLDGILRFEKLRRYALYFEVHLPGGFKLMYTFFSWRSGIWGWNLVIFGSLREVWAHLFGFFDALGVPGGTWDFQ